MAVTIITKDNFEEEITKSHMPILIDFYASWCGPCRILAPVIEQISNEMTNYKVCKINIDEEPELARKYQVTGVPTIKIIRNGIVVQSAVGVRPKDAIIKMMTSA